jgi:hypothetical protein
MLNVCNCFYSDGLLNAAPFAKCLFTEQILGVKSIKSQIK